MTYEDLRASLDKLQQYHRELIEFDLPPGETFRTEVGRLFELLSAQASGGDPEASEMLYRVRDLMEA